MSASSVCLVHSWEDNSAFDLRVSILLSMFGLMATKSVTLKEQETPQNSISRIK